MSQTHELKTWPQYFEATWRGDKPFEIRYEDRGYQKGDKVVLREFDRQWPCECEKGVHATDCEKYSGREIEAVIGFVTASTPSRGQQRGFFGNGYVVFSLCKIQKFEPEFEEPKDGEPKITVRVASTVSATETAQAVAKIAAAGGALA